jgi:hypothetical protein
MNQNPAPSGAHEAQRQRDLADSLEMLTEGDLQLMTGWTDETIRAKRKRAEGPPYVRFGLHYYYPRRPLAEFLADKVRVVKGAEAKGLL